jgi:hypothetical protein
VPLALALALGRVQADIARCSLVSRCLNGR